MPAPLLQSQAPPQISPSHSTPTNTGGPALLPPKIRLHPGVLKLQSKVEPWGRLSPLLTPRVRPGVYHGNTGTVTSPRLPAEPQHPHPPHQVCGDRGAQPCQPLLCCLLPVSASSHGAIAVTLLVMPAWGGSLPVCHPCAPCLPGMLCSCANPWAQPRAEAPNRPGTPHLPGSSPGGRLRFHKQARPLVISRFKGMSGWRQLCSPGRGLAGGGGTTETPKAVVSHG